MSTAVHLAFIFGVRRAGLARFHPLNLPPNGTSVRHFRQTPEKSVGFVGRRPEGPLELFEPVSRFATCARFPHNAPMPLITMPPDDAAELDRTVITNCDRIAAFLERHPDAEVSAAMAAALVEADGGPFLSGDLLYPALRALGLCPARRRNDPRRPGRRLRVWGVPGMPAPVGRPRLDVACSEWVARSKPWEGLGISRATWYRRREEFEAGHRRSLEGSRYAAAPAPGRGDALAPLGR